MTFLSRYPRLRGLLVFTVVVYLLLTVGMAVFQRSFIYFPTHETDGSLLEEWAVNGENYGRAHAVESPKGVWLVLHGNGGQAASHEYALRCLPMLDSAYIMEYPGYGQRPGKPSMKSINEAAANAFDELRRTHPALPVNVLGESLGSGPASYLATRADKPDRIVLVVPFDTLPSIAQRNYWYIPAWLLLRDRWNNIRALKNYYGRLDIYAASNDTAIPKEYAENLASYLPQAEYHEFQGGHNDWSKRIGRIPPQ